jgi:hypothetical protein
MGLTLYEINQQLMDAVEYSVDPDTGELLDGKELEDKINEIKLSLDDKISNIACFIKSLEAEANAVKEEKMKLAKRQKTLENKATWLRQYLDGYLALNIDEEELPKFKYKDSRCQIGYRKSQKVDVFDEKQLSDKYLIPQPPKVSLTDIKEDIKKGIPVDGADLIVRYNLNIK